MRLKKNKDNFQAGLSLVEMLVVMLIMVVVIVTFISTSGMSNQMLMSSEANSGVMGMTKTVSSAVMNPETCSDALTADLSGLAAPLATTVTVDAQIQYGNGAQQLVRGPTAAEIGGGTSFIRQAEFGVGVSDVKIDFAPQTAPLVDGLRTYMGMVRIRPRMPDGAMGGVNSPFKMLGMLAIKVNASGDIVECGASDGQGSCLGAGGTLRPDNTCDMSKRVYCPTGQIQVGNSGTPADDCVQIKPVVDGCADGETLVKNDSGVAVCRSIGDVFGQFCNSVAGIKVNGFPVAGNLDCKNLKDWNEMFCGANQVLVSDGNGNAICKNAPAVSSTPVALIYNAPTGTNSVNVTDITIGGVNVTEYRYGVGSSCGAVTYGGWTPVSTKITHNVSGFPDGLIYVCVLGRDGGGIEQPVGSPSSAFWNRNTGGNCSGSMSWNVGGNVCSATLVATPYNSISPMANSTSGGTGQASFRCNPGGAWDVSPQPGATCSPAVTPPLDLVSCQYVYGPARNSPSNADDNHFHDLQCPANKAMRSFSIVADGKGFDGSARIECCSMTGVTLGSVSPISQGFTNEYMADDQIHGGSCPAGSVLTGIKMWAGDKRLQWVENISCAPTGLTLNVNVIGSDAEVGITSHKWDDTTHATSCPANQVMSGLSIWCNSWLDNIGRRWCAGTN